jgi:acyl-CoA thioester hydrolase
MKKPYFKKKSEQDPYPIRGIVSRQVRFNEVDMLGIAWHGHYVGFFDDARVTVSQSYGIGYLQLYANGIMAPVKTVHVDFIHPLKFMDNITIEGIFHYSSASRINSEFIVRDSSDKICATGYSIQMMLNKDYELYLIQPEFFRKFCEKWKAGEIK